MNELRDENSKLAKTKEEMISDLQGKNHEIREQELKIQSLERISQESRDKTLEFEARIKEMWEENKAVNSKFEAFRVEKEHIAEKLAERESDIARLEERNSQISKIVEEQNDKNEGYATVINQLESDIEGLKQKIEDMKRVEEELQLALRDSESANKQKTMKMAFEINSLKSQITD